MKKTMVRFAGLFIAVMLVLSGCNLIGIDPLMQLDEDFAKLEKRYSGVVASYDGGEITQGEVMASLNSQYSYMSQLYNMYGITMSSDVLTNIEQSVVEEAVQNVAVARQMETRGLSLDDEKLAGIESEAEEHYKEAYDSFYANASGENDKVRARQTEYDLAVSGYTKDAFRAIEVAAANTEVVEQSVRDEIKELTEEEVREAYDAKVAEDEEAYADAPSDFETAMSSDEGTVCWMPEGYRTVKHILVIPETDILAAYVNARSAYDDAVTKLDSYRAELDAQVEDDSADEAADQADEALEVEEAEDEDSDTDDGEAEPKRSAEEIQADIDSVEAGMDGLKAEMDKAEADCLASIQDKLDEIYGKIEAGEDFDALIEAYGEDPGMKSEPSKTRGYYVSEASTAWDKNFTAGAMSLENVGDYTQTPVVSSSGVHIIRFESIVTPGAVPYDEVKEAVSEETLESRRDEHYTETLESWVAALNPEYHIEAFNLNAE